MPYRISYLVTRPDCPCARCGQPRDWHDDEPPHAVPPHAYGDDCADEGCAGYLPAIRKNHVDTKEK